jgi:2-oxoglutarate ferredoxin oxidoreductase subunit delta
MARVEIQGDLCKSCLYCIKECPKDVIALGKEVNSKGYQYVYAKAPENCIGCAMCAQICPDAVIEVYR